MSYRLTRKHNRGRVVYDAGTRYTPTPAELAAFPDRFAAEPSLPPQPAPRVVLPMEPAPEASVAYVVVHRGGGWYDVVNDQDEVQNDAAMRQYEAERLCADLSRKARRER